MVAVKNSGHYGLSILRRTGNKKNLITMIYTNPPAVVPHGALKLYLEQIQFVLDLLLELKFHLF